MSYFKNLIKGIFTREEYRIYSNECPFSMKHKTLYLLLIYYYCLIKRQLETILMSFLMSAFFETLPSWNEPTSLRSQN